MLANYKIDPAHSSAQFSVRHMMISTVRGQFHGITGTIIWDDKDITKSTVDVSIDTTTVDTQEPNRDKDLKSENFFDVAKYPTMTFKSKKIEKVGDQRYKVTGDLTLHGVTREVVLDVDGPTAPMTDPRGGLHAGAAATAKINRQDFGIKWSKALDGGGVMVGDEVAITIDVEGVKKQ